MAWMDPAFPFPPLILFSTDRLKYSNRAVTILMLTFINYTISELKVFPGGHDPQDSMHVSINSASSKTSSTNLTQ